MSTPTLNEQPKAPRGMAGASLVRAAESRTPRGALLAIREWCNRRQREQQGHRSTVGPPRWPDRGTGREVDRGH